MRKEFANQAGAFKLQNSAQKMDNRVSRSRSRSRSRSLSVPVPVTVPVPVPFLFPVPVPVPVPVPEDKRNPHSPQYRQN
jgi:hypothetical protein